MVLGLLLVLTTGCDQATKTIARYHVDLTEARYYLGGLVRVQFVENQGAFLSLGADLPDSVRPWFFVVGVSALLLVVLAFAMVSRNLSRSALISMALLAGGGLSNLVDRLLYDNRVADMFLLSVGPLHTGVFNVADVFIMAGAALLVLTGLEVGSFRWSDRPSPG
jgi:signal peptidase II